MVDEKNKEKIEGYFARVYDDYKSEDYSSAKDFVDRILNLEPNNQEAILLKKTIFCIKGKNGRYSKRNILLNKSYFEALNNWIKNKGYLETSNSMHEMINNNLDYMFKECLVYRTYMSSMPELIDLINPLYEIVKLENSTKLNNFSSYLNKIIEEGNKYITMELEQRKQEELDEKMSKRKKSLIALVFVGLIVATIVGMIVLMKSNLANKDSLSIIFFVALFAEFTTGYLVYKKNK